MEMEMKMLTWSLFGVVNPSDLIRDRTRTPFNVGRAIELKGLAFEDTKPLASGLDGYGYDALALLQEILNWTDGQPFLTQKLCRLVQTALRTGQFCSAVGESKACQQPTAVCMEVRSAAAVVEEVVYLRMIEHWESQDDPEHLRTIRDRLLREELKAPRLLGIYESVLTSSLPLCDVSAAKNRQEVEMQSDEVRSLAYDDSPEHIDLLLSGLICIQQGRLTVKNRLYETIFDLSWVRDQLSQLRPYAKQLTAWVNSERKDDSRLLRGKALKDSQAWSQERSVSEIDHDFLMASEQYDRKIVQERLKSLRLKEVEKRLEVVRRSRQKQRVFIVVLSGALSVVASLALFARVQYWTARRSQIRAMTKTAEALYASDQKLDALVQSIRTHQSLVGIGQEIPTALLADIDGMLRTSAVNAIERNRLTAGNNSNFWSFDIHPRVSDDPQDRLVATGDSNGQIALWSSQGELLNTLPAHRSRIRSIRFFPDGQKIASAGADRDVRLWTVDGELIETFKGHTDSVLALAVAPDGKKLVSGSSDRTLKLWSEGGELLQTFFGHSAPILDAAFSPNGQLIASAGEDLSIKLWTLDGKLVKTLAGHSGAIVDIDFSANGDLLASASEDSTIRYWKVATGETLRILQGHESDVLTVDFSPDGEQLVSGSRDNTLKIWNLNGDLIDTFRGHQSRVWSVKYTPDNNQIVSAAADKTARIWDLTNPLQTRFLGPSAGVVGVDTNSDASLIAAASDDSNLYIWNRRTGRIVNRLKHPASVLSVAFSPDDQLIATGSWDGTARLWDTSGEQQAVLVGHAKAVWDVTFSTDGQTIATAGADNKLRLWTRSGTLRETFSGHNSEIRSVDISADGQFLLSASLDETVKLWDMDGRLLRIFKGESGFIDARFSSNGELIAAAGFDNKIRIWRVENGALITTIEGHEEEVRSVSFSQNGEQIVSAGGDGQVKIWSVEGELVATLSSGGEAMWQALFAEGLDRDLETARQLVIAAGEDRQATLWNLESVLDDESLMKRGCQWVADYLATSVEIKGDRDLCEGFIDPQPTDN